MAISGLTRIDYTQDGVQDDRGSGSVSLGASNGS